MQNDDIKFDSLKDLYLRIKPALSARSRELKRNGFDYINEDDIWNYFKETKWRKTANLSLHEMVSDIFNVDEILIDEYLKKKMGDKTRTLYFNSEDDVHEEEIC